MFSSALKSFSSNITANYVISSNPTSLAGAWKVFDGKSKKSDKVVSVFVFDRKTLESSGGSFDSRSSATSRKKINDEVVERLKKEASSLARLRHPNILELAEPVEDTRGGGLMFATEPITATLAGLLKSQDNQENIRGRGSRHRQEDAEPNGLEIDELEIQKGLFQIAKGLEFLHESAGLVHGNLTPEAIYINQKSDWKISGLAFAGPPDSSSSTTPSTTPPIALSELLYFDPRLPRSVQLDLNYTSPDFVMDTNISSGSDMFSLGLVMVALYNSPHESPMHTNNNLSTYKKLFSSSSTVPSASNNFLSSKPLPQQLKSDVLPRLITRRPAQRISAREFQESTFFDNILVSTIRFLDSLPGKTPNEKSQFLRGLPRILEQFPKSVLQKKVLPALLEETKDKELLSLILTDVFKIIDILPSGQRAFVDKVLPKLREVFGSSATKIAPQERDMTKEAGLAVVLDSMGLIADNCTGKEFKDDVLPILQFGLESPTHSLVDKSLRCLSTILAVLDFSTIKNELFPIVAAVFSKTSSLAIKVRGLEAFVVLCGGSNTNNHDIDSKPNKANMLDKYTVQEKIVPLMKGIKTKEPAVMMASLAVFKQVGKIADVDFLATEVLPILWNFSLGPLLNLQQFQQYMDLIKSLSARIEQEQTRKLRELSSNSSNGLEPSLRSNELMSTSTSSDPFSQSDSVGEDDFEQLVLGKGMTNKSSIQTLTPSTSFANPMGARQGAQDFGWNSTSSNITTKTLLPLQQRSAIPSRTITPDHTLSPFVPLASSNFPIQPSLLSSSAFSTNNNPWSSPLQLQSNASASAVSTNAFNSMPVSTPSWSLPPPPPSQKQQDLGINGFSGMSEIGGMGTVAGFSQQTIRPMLSIASNNSFAIAPPPQSRETGTMSMQAQTGRSYGSGQSQSQGFGASAGTGQPEKKSGLDAYESLI